MKKVIKYLDEHFEETILAVFLSAIAVIMLLQVIMRYVFNHALDWPEEICRYLYIWCCFMSISYCISKGTELKVDLFERLFRGIGKKIVRVTLQAISMVLYGYMFYSTFSLVGHVFTTGQKSSAAQIPMSLVYIVLPISMFLAVVRCFQQIVLIIKAKPEEKEDAS